MINAKTKLCCVVGHPVDHSLSPIMHNAAYEKLSLNFAFVAFDIENIKEFIDAAKTLNIIGIAVTVPYKKEVIKYLDSVDDKAKEIGAVNTIINIDGALSGMNTDWVGAIKALKEKTDLKDKNLVIIGNGGASLAIKYGVEHEGSKVKVIGRNRGGKEREIIRGADIIVNATPVGMGLLANDSPIDKDLIRQNQIVMDIVFHPHETKLIQDAKEKGATVVYGYKMLLYQAVEQFKIFTGHDAPRETMENSLKKYLN